MNGIIIEGEPATRKAFMRIAKEVPQLEEAADFGTGASAIAFAKKADVDVAFVDVALPDSSGYDIAETLKRMRPNISIIFITAFKPVKSELLGKLGAGMVLKPFTPRDIKKAVAKIRHAE